jgi:16S rRNA (cytidine1402-2'-O)-methyltransferase
MITALTIAGLPTDRSCSQVSCRRRTRRGDVLASFAAVPATLVFYETGPRLVASLEAMATVLPGREVAVARELTKLHEECRTGTAADLADYYRAHPPKERSCCSPARAAPEAPDEDVVEAELRAALAELPPSQAAARVAKKHGLDRKALYAQAMALKA